LEWSCGGAEGESGSGCGLFGVRRGMRGVRGSLFVAGCELGGGFAAGLGGIFTGFRRLLAHLSGVVDLAGAAGQGDVGTAFGEEGLLLLAEVADDLGGMAHSAHATGVGGGEIEALNESEGAPFGDAVGGEGVDDAGDGDLDGLAVLKLGELDVRAGIDAVGIKVGFVAIAVVAAMKAIVEVAEDRSAEGDGAALEAVGEDVTAEFVLQHDFSFLGGVPPWWTLWVSDLFSAVCRWVSLASSCKDWTCG